jgi:hypothetical protein
MTMLTARERGDMAERMVPVACQLACIAHGDGGQPDIAHVLTQLDDNEREALIVVLAAMVDPSLKLADLLGYVTWDEEGRPAPRQIITGTVRQNARQQWTPIHKPAVKGGPRERVLVEDSEELHAQGLDPQEIAARLGTTWSRIQTAYSRCQVPTPKARAAA